MSPARSLMRRCKLREGMPFSSFSCFKVNILHYPHKILPFNARIVKETVLLCHFGLLLFCLISVPLSGSRKNAHASAPSGESVSLKPQEVKWKGTRVCIHPRSHCFLSYKKILRNRKLGLMLLLINTLSMICTLYKIW
jgi:hypothetical protein